jgi:6,7-dimethyl-8-ribityllumazine synthase
VITAEWNGHITSKLARGAVETLTANGILPSDIISIPVPGAVELTYAAARVIEHQHPDAVIVFGAVVRGDTPHFDYVCESVTQGVTLLNSTGDVPVIFGLLTVDNEQQALDRIGGPAGHKGVEAAETAIRMIALASSI